MAGVVLLYLGLILVLAGAVTMFTRWRWRHHVLLAGVGVAAIGALLPAGVTRIAEPRARIDQFAPAWQFHEAHALRISAPCTKAWAAIKAVTAGEIRLFRTLTWIRRLGRPGPESLLNAPERMPIIEVATSSGFRLLAEDAEREIVIGTTLIPPARASAFMNFRVTEVESGSCEVTTETRVYAIDASARRRFAVYWRVIYPGSALIRRMWLRAIKERADAPGPSSRAQIPR